jgi:hypothetical protein
MVVYRLASTADARERFPNISAKAVHSIGRTLFDQAARRVRFFL